MLLNSFLVAQQQYFIISYIFFHCTLFRRLPHVWNVSYRVNTVGAPTGARVPFVRVPSYQGEFARVEKCPGKTNDRVERCPGGQMSG